MPRSLTLFTRWISTPSNVLGGIHMDCLWKEMRILCFVYVGYHYVDSKSWDRYDCIESEIPFSTTSVKVVASMNLCIVHGGVYLRLIWWSGVTPATKLVLQIFSIAQLYSSWPSLTLWPIGKNKHNHRMIKLEVIQCIHHIRIPSGPGSIFLYGVLFVFYIWNGGGMRLKICLYSIIFLYSIFL